MNKKILIGVIAVGVVVLSLFIFFIKKEDISTSGTNSQVSNSLKTLKDIFEAGSSRKCSYPEGVVYVSGGKMRNDFTTKENGKEISGHMIVDGNVSYVWMEGSKTGFKTTFNLDASATPEDGQSSQSSGVDLTRPENYVCESWITDSEKFITPSDVSFSDINSIIPSSIPSSVSEESTDPCSYCGALSGDQKTQCLSAMNCK